MTGTPDPLEFPTTATFGSLVVLLGNGATPEVFSAPCGMDTKAFNRGSSTSTAAIPPCNNPDAPAQQVTAITAKTKAVTGSGVFAKEDAPDWSKWHESGAPRNVRVWLKGVEYFEGAAVLSTYNITGTKGQNADLLQYSVAIDQYAAWTQHDGDPT